MTTKYKHPSLREAIVEMADDMHRLGIMGDAKYEKITKSSGNVFADLGVPDADTHLVKAKLVSNILDTMRDQGLTQTKAAELMGITQPEISEFSNGHFRDVTAEYLMRLLTRLGCDVDIVVRPKDCAVFKPIRMKAITS